MSPRYTPLDNVRLFFDEKNNTVRLTSTDARFNGESFVMQMSPGTRADELARHLLSSSGVAIPGQNRQATLARLPRQLSQSAEVIPLGYQDEESIINWDIRYVPKGVLPTTLGIVGRPGSGKSTVAQHALNHALRWGNEYEVYVCEKETDHLRGGKRVSVENLDALPGRKNHHYRRFIIVDGFEEDLITSPFDQKPSDAYYKIMSLLRCARACNDIIVITAHRFGDIKNYVSHMVAMGRHDLRDRIYLGIDSAGVINDNEGVYIYWNESDDPQERSWESFTTFASEIAPSPHRVS